MAVVPPEPLLPTRLDQCASAVCRLRAQVDVSLSLLLVLDHAVARVRRVYHQVYSKSVIDTLTFLLCLLRLKAVAAEEADNFKLAKVRVHVEHDQNSNSLRCLSLLRRYIDYVRLVLGRLVGLVGHELVVIVAVILHLQFRTDASCVALRGVELVIALASRPLRSYRRLAPLPLMRLVKVFVSLML